MIRHNGDWALIEFSGEARLGKNVIPPAESDIFESILIYYESEKHQ